MSMIEKQIGELEAYADYLKDSEGILKSASNAMYGAVDTIKELSAKLAEKNLTDTNQHEESTDD